MGSTVEQRTADQNRFYWRMIGNWSSWLNVNPEDLHDFLKNKFLRDLRTLKIGSTANLNKSEFVRYLDDVTDFLTTQFNKKEQTMNQGQYPQQQGYPPPQGAGYPQPQGYPPTQGYPQQPQSENLYVGSGKTRQTQYGGIFKLSFSADDLRKMMQYLNESGWVTIDILQRREISPSGSTHYGKIDTWRPQPQGYPPPPPQGYPQQRTTGYPPPPSQGYSQPPQNQPQQRRYDDGGFSQTAPPPPAPPQYNSAPQPPPPPQPQVPPPAEHQYSTEDIPQMPSEEPPF